MAETLLPEITNDHVDSVCKIGQAEACCRYLTMAPEGFECVKHLPISAYIDRKVEADTYGSKGDNCEGRRGNC